MSQINEKSILKAIDRKVCVENKIVYTKDLMNEFKVNIIFVDRLMNEYIKKCREKEIPIKVTYLLSGYNNDASKPDEIRFHRFIIVDEDELEERKKYFTELTGCQVRTIESAENNEKFNEAFTELPIIDDIETVQRLQKLTLISNKNIELRENRVKCLKLPGESKKSDLTMIKANNKTIDNEEEEKIANSNDDCDVAKCVKKALNNKKESIKNMFTRIGKSRGEKEISLTNDCNEKKENDNKDNNKANNNRDDKCLKVEVDLDKKKSEKFINDTDNCDYAKHDTQTRKVNKRKSSELAKNSKKVKQDDKSNKKRKRIRFMASDSESDEKDEDSDKEDEQDDDNDDPEDEKMSQSDNEEDKTSEADDDSDDEKKTEKIICEKRNNSIENPSNGTAWVLKNVDETAVDEDGYLVTKKRKKIVEAKVEEEKAKQTDEKKKKQNKSSPPEQPVARPKKGKLAAGQASIMSFFKPAVKT